MIAAIPIENDSKQSLISKRFGRSEFFAIVYSKAKEVRIIANPCFELKTGTGNCLADHLRQSFGVDTFIAFELGWKIQQLAYKMDIQIIVLDNKNKFLTDILNYMKIN